MEQTDIQSLWAKLEQWGAGILESWRTWVWGAVTVFLAVVIGLFATYLLFYLLRFLVRNRFGLDTAAWRRLRRPVGFAFPLLAVQLVLRQIGLSQSALAFAEQVTGLALIASVIWLLVAIVGTIQTVILSRYHIEDPNNREARHMHTQFRIIGRTLSILIGIIGFAAMLMTFPSIRQLGASILASAGIAGLVLGLAARPAVENMVAGLQLAFSKPISLDDVVVIQGEWGHIEEITATYVVVKIWDQRRLIVPFSWILQQPFQNWTRSTAEIMGTVFLHADYTVPVDALRAELERICKGSDLWDGRVCMLVVTDAKPETLELRALVSAADSGAAWDLRCLVREKLIAFLQENHPRCLPRMRAQIEDRAKVEG